MHRIHTASTISRRAAIQGAGGLALTTLAGIATTMTTTTARTSTLDAILPGLAPGDRACDCHVHVFEPSRFPYAPNRTYTPGVATVADLRAHLSGLGAARVVLVQPSVYGNDNRCLVGALGALGPQVARGVAVIDPAETTDAELQRLHDAGVRAIRVNLETGGERGAPAARKALLAAVDRVASRRWGVQVYADLAVITGIADTIAALPVPIILDHFAGAHAEAGTVQPGFDVLLDLVKNGKAWVKLSGVYRVSRKAPDYEDVRPIAEALIAANPNQLVWASDWPHTGSAGSRKDPTAVEPFRQIDDRHVLGFLGTWTSDPLLQRRILVDNAARFFDF